LKRILSALIITLISIAFISDLFFLEKYSTQPDRFDSFHNFSFLHGYLLSTHGYYLAILKLLFSTTLLLVWVSKLIKPVKSSWACHWTSIYALFLMFNGLLMLTGLVGVLQVAAGRPVNIFDFSILVSLPTLTVLILLLAVISLPILLMILLRLYNYRFIQC
jgi:hypothetical protein